MNNSFRNTKLIFIVILTFLFTGSFAYADFSDLQGHWAKDCINKWADNGVINGFNDGTVHPNDDITRAEFVKIINKIFNFTEKASKNYSDVKRGQWYTDDFAKAKQAGYLKDFVDTKALPTKKLNREQAATILYNVLQMQTVKSSGSKTFIDAYEIPKYASEPVKVLSSKGIINGYPDGSFKPGNVIKRSEALKMVDNVIKGYFNKKGTYSDQKLRGSAIINASGVTLKDVEIQGDLYLTEGIGEGEVTLQNVEVSGKTYINGGGENSVYFIDSTIEDVIVNKANGKVRLVSKGKSNIKNVILESGAKLEEKSITKKYNGFRDVEVSEKVPYEQDAEFSGDFEDVTISSSNELTFDDCDIEQVKIKGNDDKKVPTVKMLKATVKSLVSNAEGAKIEMKKGTKVESVALEEKTDLSVDKGAEVEKLSIDKDAKGTDIDIDGKVEKVANDATDVKANGKTIKKGSNVSTSKKSSSSHHSSGGSSSGGDTPSTPVDKTAPVVTGVENNKEYQTKVTPVSTDIDIETVILTKGSIEVVDYQLGTDITEAGEYILTVTDKTGNTTVIRFAIKKASGDEIDFYPEASASLTENNNKISFHVHGKITTSIDTSKLIYKTSKDATNGYALSDNYVYVDGFKLDLKPGEYYYLNSGDDTIIYIKLFSEDVKAIKRLDGYGNVSYFVNNDNDILEASEGWYGNAEAGTKSVSISNDIKVNLKTSIDGGVFCFDVNEKSTGSRGFSGNKNSNEKILVNTQTKKIIFYKGEYIPNVRPTSGEMKIIKYQDDFIENGITVDDSNWIVVNEENFGKEDTTAPVITGVENNKEYQTKVTPVSTDTDIDKVTLTKDGLTVQNYKLKTDITEVGNYVLTVTDNAGNTTEIRFTIKKESDETISFTYPNRYSQFIENNNRLDIDIIGELTQEVNINKLTYTTSADVAYKLQSNYQKVGYTYELQPGKYCYSQSGSDTTICIELTTQDAKAIKKLDNYGNNTMQHNNNDSIVAEDGWYANISGGSNKILVENEINFKNISDVSGLYCYNENNEQLESFSKECIRENYMMINAGTRKIVFYKGNDTSGNNPSSGEILIKDINSDIIKNDIDVGVGNWKLIPELQSTEVDENNKIVTLTFNKKIKECTSFIPDLKSNIEIATDGNNFKPLNSNDIVEISGGKLVVTFDGALTTNTNKIKIAENTLVDEDDYVLGVEVVTDVIDASGVDELVTPVVDTVISATAVNEGETLASSTLTGTFKVSAEDSTVVPGTLTWTDDTTVVNATGDFGWTFTPTDKDAYEVVTGTVSVTAK